jgi:sugar phosphate isomerase/epimerase
MKLGAVEYMTKRASDLATFRAAKRAGLKGVEPMITRSELFSPGQERLKALKEAQRKTGLAIPSMMLSEHNFERGVAMSDPAKVEAAYEDIRKAVDWAVELGAGVILVPFFGPAELSTKEDFERAVRGFQGICAYALAKGVKLGYEGTYPAAEIRRLAKRVNSKAFGCYFDFGNVVWRGMDTATEIRGLRDLIVQVHIKDTQVGPSDVQMGEGRVNYAESVKALREVGFDGWVVLESRPYPDDPQSPPPPAKDVVYDVKFTRSWLPELA